MAGIELKAVSNAYQAAEVIHGIDLTIADGSFTVLVGPSGCGKSTLLRMMAGLEVITSGEVHIDGQRRDHLLPSARGMAMVFQSYALYRHMNVEQNLRFGLENQHLPRSEITARVAKAADILQIQPLLAQRGISRAKAGDVLTIGVPPDFAHVFDAQGRAIGAAADWRSAYLR